MTKAKNTKSKSGGGKVTKVTSKSKSKLTTNSKQAAGNGRSKKASSGSSSTGRFIVSPYTNEKVYIAQATIKDLKSPQTYRNDGKRLWTISSQQLRYDHYQQVARVISTIEQNLLPPSGMRSWQVEAAITEPDGRVLFRPYKGKMELAVLPHLLERIPDPPVWPGKRLQPPDEYEVMEGETEASYETGLAKREMSALSCLAFDELRKHPWNYSVPQITMKWKSPDGHKPFTSRTAAWEHAKVLCQKEVMINRHLEGIGPSGKKLQPFVPSLPNALKVGQLRFERDGLWVVGQELTWQDGREEELLIEKAEAETEAAATPKIYKSGLQLYIATNRQSYRDNPKNHCQNLAQADRKLREEWRKLTPKQQEEWNSKVQSQLSDEEEDDEEETESDAEPTTARDNTNDDEHEDSESGDGTIYIRPSTLFLQARRQSYRYEQQMKVDPTGQEHFTLAQADKELMAIWKAMTKEEKDDWLSSFSEDRAKDAPEADSAEAENSPDSSTIIKDNERMAKDAIRSESRINVNTQTVSTSSSSSDIQGEEENKIALCVEKTMEQTNATDSTPRDRRVVGAEEAKKEDELMKPVAQTDEDRALDSTGSARSNVKFPPVYSTAKTVQITDEVRAVITPTLAPSSSSHKKKSPVENGKKFFSNGRIKLPTDKASARWCLDEEKIELCKDACMEHYEAVMRTVKGRNLLQELEDGFDVMRERGRGRFDMTLPAFDEPQFDFLTDPEKTPWMPIVRAILGDDAVLVHKGCFLSLPGAEKQVYHQDGLHLNNQTQRPCHAINVFVPLVDLHSRNGPTEFVLGSHILGQEGFDKDFTETPMPKAGKPVIFDYRLGHRGLANSSDKPRPILYTTYSANSAEGKTFKDTVNFSKNMTSGKKYHKIGDLSAKPLSREERRSNRKRSIESRQLQEEIKNFADACSSETESKSKPEPTNESFVEEKIADTQGLSPDETNENPFEPKRAKKPSVVESVMSVPVDVAKSHGYTTSPSKDQEGT